MKKILTIIIIITFFVQYAKAETLTGTDCNNKCIWEYDTTTNDIIIKPKPGVVGDIHIATSFSNNFPNLNNGNKPTIRNATIAEGITSIDSNVFDSAKAKTYGTLKFPHSLKKITQNGGTDVYFRTVELDMENLEHISTLNFRAVENLIITPAEGKSLPAGSLGRLYGSGTLWGSHWENYAPLNISCRGDLELCRQNVAAVRGSLPGTIDYYKGYDENGNLIEIWDENGKKTYSYTYANNGDYAMYDGDGNFMGNFMADGSKRRIYTVDDATNAVGKNNKNTFSIRYR